MSKDELRAWLQDYRKQVEEFERALLFTGDGPVALPITEWPQWIHDAKADRLATIDRALGEVSGIQ